MTDLPAELAAALLVIGYIELRVTRAVQQAVAVLELQRAARAADPLEGEGRGPAQGFWKGRLRRAKPDEKRNT